jgi:hypothetical protein
MAGTTRTKRFLLALAALIALGGGIGYFSGSRAPVPSGNPTAAPEGPDWQDLLAGERATRWRNITDESEIFEIQGDTLHIPGNSLYPLRYVAWGDERLGDFELHLEFKVASGANSGVFLRAQPNDPVYRGFEVQVLEDHGAPPNKNGSGAIYDVVTPMFNLARPAGEWNSYDITVRGTSVVVIMNGWKVIDTDLALMTTPLGKFSVAYADLPREGLLMLQDHGGEVWYRNIRLKRL